MTVRGTNGERLRAPRLTNRKGAAEYLGTTERHIKRLVYERQIPHVHIGRKLLFDYDDLDRFIKANRTEAAS